MHDICVAWCKENSCFGGSIDYAHYIQIHYKLYLAFTEFSYTDSMAVCVFSYFCGPFSASAIPAGPLFFHEPFSQWIEFPWIFLSRTILPWTFYPNSSKCQPQACIKLHMGSHPHTVLLPPACFLPQGKILSPITVQPSTAVTHCILAASHFIYVEGMEGWLGESTQLLRESNPDPLTWKAVTLTTRPHKQTKQFKVHIPSSSTQCFIRMMYAFVKRYNILVSLCDVNSRTIWYQLNNFNLTINLSRYLQK